MDNKTKILNAALELAEADCLRNVKRSDVATKARVSTGLINWYFGTTERLRDAVMELAVERRSLSVIAEGLANGHASARDAPLELKMAARQALI